MQGHHYKGYLDGSHFVLLNSRGDTVLHPDKDYYMSFSFLDLIMTETRIFFWRLAITHLDVMSFFCTLKNNTPSRK